MNAPQTTRRKVLIREREDLSPPGRRAWLPAGVLEYKLLFRAAACATPRGIPQAWAMVVGRLWEVDMQNVREWEEWIQVGQEEEMRVHVQGAIQ